MKTVLDWLLILTNSGIREDRAQFWAPIFAATVKDGSFDNSSELTSFLATIFHESDMLQKLKENGNYSADRIRALGNASGPASRWRSLVPRADELAHNPEAFFEAAYGGRMGNNQPGDGAKYPGRGLIGVTGKDGYSWLGDRAGQDLVSNPELLEQPTFALELSIDWWQGKIPDSVLGDEFKIRKIINGGTFGLAEVQALANRIQGALA